MLPRENARSDRAVRQPVHLTGEGCEVVTPAGGCDPGVPPHSGKDQWAKEERMIALSNIQALGPSIESEEETDVVVVGGGTAGWAAAYASARKGSRTTIVESLPFLGGTMTGAMVLGSAGFRHQGLATEDQELSYEGDQLVRGVAQEYLNRLIDRGGAWGVKDSPTTKLSFDHELAKVVLEDMMVDAGVDIWFNAQFVDVVMDGNRIAGLLVSTNGGLNIIWAKAVVDSSGNGEVAYRAGAPYEVGRATDGRPQASSLYFLVGGVNIRKTLDYFRQHPDELRREGPSSKSTPEVLEQRLEEGKPLMFSGFTRARQMAVDNGDFPEALGAQGPVYQLGPFRTLWRGGRVDPYITAHNMDTCFGVMPTNRKELSQAVMASRKFILGLVDFYRKYIPGYENSYLLLSAPMFGVRESRRIIGDYVLTEEDVLEGREFMDAIGRCGAYIDVHDEDGGVRPTDLREVGGAKGWYHVPYRVLLPKDVEGLLTAGRCVSADHIAQGSIRNQGGCMATGHAAGAAAALAAQEGTTPRDLNVEVLQTALRNQAAII